MALAAVGLTTHIYNNHLKSTLLLLGFPLLMLGMMVAFVTAMNAMMQGGASLQEINWSIAFDKGMGSIPRYGLWVLLGTAVWFTVAWFFHTSMMRAATGAVPVTRKEYPKLYNMLENLCISRGIAMPTFEIIDSPALNAFASGINDKTYRIVLTRGLVERLEDDELEAVIAHELTHILNRDVRLLIISVIFVGMISFFAEMAFRMMVFGGHASVYRSRDSRSSSGHIAIFLVAMLILAIGYIFAILIRFALSRKREYLADAGAVELTRNPEAMMRALMRISGQDKVRGMPDEVQQMCIENSHNFMGVFATHPPIEDRINTISKMTNTPVPTLPVSLKRGPREPWGEAEAPEAAKQKRRGPWG